MLSPRAEQTINDYLNLPFPGLAGVRCPYFNNTRLNLRGQLRALVGKGTPNDIVEEGKIISIQYHAGLFEKNGACCLHHKHTGAPVTPDDMRKFLITYHLGIECSGFVTNVLREHFRETKHCDFTKKIFIVSRRQMPRWIISRLRPVENIGVRTYADDRNTTLIKNAKDIQTGDLIVMLETGPNKKRNHIVLVTAVQRCHPEQNEGSLSVSSGQLDRDSSRHPAGTQNDRPNDRPMVIDYVHARAWTSEGQFGHGVNRGTITITNPDGTLLDQTWTEKDLTNEQNETYLEAKNAARLEIRRLTI